MIKVTGFDSVEFYINCNLIETIRETPDTVITLSNGKKLIVKEGSDEIVKRIIEYRQKTLGAIQVEKVMKD